MNEFTNFGDIAPGNTSLTYSGKRKNHICHICFKEYVDLKSIRRHLLRIHNIEPPEGTVLYECPECFQKFSDKSHLDRHMLKHTGVKSHVCPKCNKGFGRKEHLTRHLVKVRCDQVKEVKMKNDSGSVKVKKKMNTDRMSENASQIDSIVLETNAPELLTILKVESVQTEFPECEICSKRFVHQ